MKSVTNLSYFIDFVLLGKYVSVENFQHDFRFLLSAATLSMCKEHLLQAKVRGLLARWLSAFVMDSGRCHCFCAHCLGTYHTLTRSFPAILGLLLIDDVSMFWFAASQS